MNSCAVGKNCAPAQIQDKRSVPVQMGKVERSQGKAFVFVWGNEWLQQNLRDC